MPLLVLFDVDGTLFLTHDPLAGQAMRETLGARFGASLPEDAVERVDHLGQTSLRIALVSGSSGSEMGLIRRGSMCSRPLRASSASRWSTEL